MTKPFASGKYAFGFCDTCGFRVKLTDMKENYVRGSATGVLTCPTCNDPDHPQNWLGRYPIDDPQALQRPRPDAALAESREIPPE